MQYIKAWTRGAIKINSEKSTQQVIALTGQSGEAPEESTGQSTFSVFRSSSSQVTLTGAFQVSRVRAAVKIHSPVDPPSTRRSIRSTPVNLSPKPNLSGSFCVIKLHSPVDPPLWSPVYLDSRRSMRAVHRTPLENGGIHSPVDPATFK